MGTFCPEAPTATTDSDSARKKCTSRGAGAVNRPTKIASRDFSENISEYLHFLRAESKSVVAVGDISEYLRENISEYLREENISEYLREISGCYFCWAVGVTNLPL